MATSPKPIRIFHRPSLAAEVLREASGEAIFSDGASGVILAAPRRTGKTKFLTADLQPEMERRGIVVVYADLWADVSVDPAVTIMAAIEDAYRRQLGAVSRAAMKANLAEFHLGGDKMPAGLAFDARQIGKVDDRSVASALKQLREAAGKPIALIIDEAQQALSTQAGTAAMTALKSARDQMNIDSVVLMIVMTGSDRDKLLRLVDGGGSAPFKGTSIRHFPELGDDYVDFVACQVEAAFPSFKPVDRAALSMVFKHIGCRPEIFMRILGEALPSLDRVYAPGERFEPVAMDLARAQRRKDEDQMSEMFLGLTPVEQAVLTRVLSRRNAKARPYDVDALAQYKSDLGVNVTTGQVQAAIESMRSATPPILWRSAYAVYAPDDSAMYDWYARLLTHGAWPPSEAGPSGPPVSRERMRG